MSIKTLNWKKHHHIGLDLDETLAATMSGMLEYSHSIGKLLHITHLDQIHKHDTSWLGSDITPEEAIALWEGYGKSTPHPYDVLPIEDALEGVRKLHEIGKNIAIVTARSDKEPWKVERTHLWVRWHLGFLAHDRIYFVNHFSEDARPKSEICKKMYISLMIDDAMENAYELVRNDISCILLEKPWNRDVEFDHPLLYRAKNWKEITDSLTHER